MLFLVCYRNNADGKAATACEGYIKFALGGYDFLFDFVIEWIGFVICLVAIAVDCCLILHTFVEEVEGKA